MKKAFLLFAVVAGSLRSPQSFHGGCQAAGYAVNRYEPSEPGSDWFTTESLDLRGNLRPQAGIMGDWAYRPLVLGPADAPRTIVDQVFVHHRASLVLGRRLRIGVSLPVAFYQAGDQSAVAGAAAAVRPPAREQALGDLRLGVDARLFHSFEDSVRGAAGLQVFLPTGSRGSYTSDGTVRLAPRLLLAGLLGAFDWALKLGFAFRPHDAVFAGRALGSEAFAAVSAGVKVNDRFVVGPELHGTATVTGRAALSGRAVPLEVLFGARARFANDFQAGTAIGTGLDDGDGAPRMRVLAMVEWAPDYCVDKDADGVCEPYDACPEVAGPRTRNRRTNGCPTAKEKEEGAPPREPTREPERKPESEPEPPPEPEPAPEGAPAPE
jgi:OmpA-OmpF porin, OOP family